MADEINGRVTTREFYDALLDQNKERQEMELRQNTRTNEMERRIIEKFDGLQPCDGLKNIDKRMTYQERKSNVQDGVVAFMGVVAGTLSAWLFGKQ